MITPKEFNELKTESILSNTFSMGKDSNGEKWFVLDRFIVDEITFKLLILWRMTTYNSYMWRIIENAKKVPIIKKYNSDFADIASSYYIINKLYGNFFNLTKDQSKKDLINRYKQFIDD